MTSCTVPAALRSTAFLPETERSASGEMSLLGAHCARCSGFGERWYSIRGAVESLDAFVAPRFITTLVVIGAVLGAASLMV